MAPEHGVLDLQFAICVFHLVHAHLLSRLSELHLVILTSYAFYQLAHLKEAVTRERRVLEVQFLYQRVPLVLTVLLSRLSEP